MKTAADIEEFLHKLELAHEEPRDDTYVVTGPDGVDNIIVTIAGPVLVFRVKLMEVPSPHGAGNREELFRLLLELNATEMMHGAYGIEDDSVVICRRARAREPRLQRVPGHHRRHLPGGRVSHGPPRQVPGGRQMGIFSRLGTLIKSNINDLISKAEDPEKMLNQVLVDMQNQLVEAKKQVAVAIADEKRLQEAVGRAGRR